MVVLKSVLLTTAEVAALLRISPRTVRLWAECSELPALRIGRQWRFRVGDISEWFKRGVHDEGNERPSLTNARARPPHAPSARLSQVRRQPGAARQNSSL